MEGYSSLLWFALDLVNRNGGSYAWAEYGLTRPVAGKWIPSGIGWVCEVYQPTYGHKARKRTWWYWVGEGVPLDANQDSPEGTPQVGWTNTKRPGRNKPTLSKRDANATPIDFAKYLIDLVDRSL